VPTIRSNDDLTYLTGARPAVLHPQLGFSLLDLVIVIVILGILGTIAVPQFHSMMGARRLNAASGEFVSALQYARNLAVKYQRPFGLRANVAGNWFRVYDDKYKTDAGPHHDVVPPVDAFGVVLNPLDKTWYVIDYDTMDTYEGVTMTSIPPSTRLCFYPDGHSSSSDSTFVLSHAGDQRTITVNGTTGRIHVQ
jgi:type II secretion system protein H